MDEPSQENQGTIFRDNGRKTPKVIQKSLELPFLITAPQFKGPADRAVSKTGLWDLILLSAPHFAGSAPAQASVTLGAVPASPVVAFSKSTQAWLLLHKFQRARPPSRIVCSGTQPRQRKETHSHHKDITQSRKSQGHWRPWEPAKLQRQDPSSQCVRKIGTSVLVGWKAKTPARLCPEGMTSAPVDLEGSTKRIILKH